MNKNTFWAILVSSVILIGFMVIQTKFFTPKSNGTEIAAESTVAENSENAEESKALQLASISSVDGRKEAEKTFDVTTEKFHLVLSSKGGDIIKYELLEFDDKTEGKVQIVDSVEDVNRALAISFGTVEKSLENGILNDNFKATKIDDLTYLFENSFTLKDADGKNQNVVLQKKYSFHEGDYLFRLDVSMIMPEGVSLDFDGASYTLRTAPQIGPHYNSKRDRYENRTLIIFTDKEKAKKNTIKDNQFKIYDKPYLWTGVTGKYFGFLIVPQDKDVMSDILFSKAYDKNQYPNAQAMLERKAASGSFTDSYYIYAGPKVSNVLKAYNKPEKNSWGASHLKLDESLNTSGFLSWLEVAMKWIMEIIYKIIPNWGVAIIIMTILLRLALFPLTKKSSESSIKMQELQPKIQEIQAKYKDNPEKMNVEMSKFYKEAGYNPLMGCLPLLIQFPLLIAMYNLFNNYFEFRGAMFIPGWIPDLSVGDTVYSIKHFSLPLLGTEIRLLPIIYLASQILTMVFTGMDGATTGAASSSQKSMKIMMYVMPVMFFFMFYNAPAGLILYWTISNLFSLGQQMVLKSMKKKKEAKKALEANNKKVPDFVPRKKKK